ncbi:MAG: hypothetical protein ABIN36_10640 [Ferruginibacter sp.]
MKKIFLSVLATAIMTSFAFANEGGGKKNKGKKAAKTACCDKSNCPKSSCDKNSNCGKTTCPYPVPGCCSKKA